MTGIARTWKDRARRNRLVLFTSAVVMAYAAFVQWIWGWPSILGAWRDVGTHNVALALLLLVGTYFLRSHRIASYFPRETAGRFLRLFRVTQVHNLLNIMLPLRAGETSFPLLMRSEFQVPLAHGTSALVVLRLLDLHALFAAAGLGLIAGADFSPWALLAWLAFLLSPLIALPFRDSAIAMARRRLGKFRRIVDEIDQGIPNSPAIFMRAWLLTVLNWGVKVLVLAWVLGLMGVGPVAACFGGALGGELSSVLPVHAPAGVGTYPAGITAGAAAFGADKNATSLELLARSSINAHLLTIVAALAGTGLSLLLPGLAGMGKGRRARQEKPSQREVRD